MEMMRNPRFLRALFILQATMWIVVGMLLLLFYAIRTNAGYLYIISILIFAGGAWLFFIGFFLARKSKIAYLLALLTTILIIVFGILDDFGLPDLLFLVINIFILVDLLLNWPTFMQKTK